MEIVSPPKVEGRVLTYNQANEFTRRVPTFVTKKQQMRDSKIVKQICIAYDQLEDAERVLDIFFSKHHLLSDPVYWEVLRSVWISCVRTEIADRFRPMFQSNRRAKSWLMTIEDKHYFDNMSFPVTLYRAYPEGEDRGISWTDDEEWCRKYASSCGRKIKSRQFMREEITAYFSRRGESEYIILD